MFSNDGRRPSPARNAVRHASLDPAARPFDEHGARKLLQPAGLWPTWDPPYIISCIAFVKTS